MRLLRAAVGWALLFAPVALAATEPSEPPCDLALATTLTDRQLATLRAAVRTTAHYDVELLVGSVDGQPRTLVLLGEGHWKDATASEVGRHILAAFPDYALEGPDMDRFWGGTVLLGTMWLKTWFMTRFRGVYPSTIGDARAMVEVVDQARAFRAGLAAAIDAVPDEARAWARFRVPEGLVSCEQALRIRDDLDVLLANAPERRYFRLEENYVPSLPENLGLVGLPLAADLGMVCAAGAVVCGTAAALATGDPAWTKLVAVGLAGGFFVKSTTAEEPARWNPAARVFRAFYRWSASGRRDPAMARRLEAIFASDRSMPTLLAVLGRGHLPQVGETLCATGRWHPVPLLPPPR